MGEGFSDPMTFAARSSQDRRPAGSLFRPEIVDADAVTSSVPREEPYVRPVAPERLLDALRRFSRLALTAAARLRRRPGPIRSAPPRFRPKYRT